MARMVRILDGDNRFHFFNLEDIRYFTATYSTDDESGDRWLHGEIFVTDVPHPILLRGTEAEKFMRLLSTQLVREDIGGPDNDDQDDGPTLPPSDRYRPATP